MTRLFNRKASNVKTVKDLDTQKKDAVEKQDANNAEMNHMEMNATKNHTAQIAN